MTLEGYYYDGKKSWRLYKKKDGKSINWKWFHTNAFELKRLKTPLRWEMIPLFEEHL